MSKHLTIILCIIKKSIFRENNEANVNAEECSMLSDSSRSNLLDSEIINEILEEPIYAQTTNDDIFFNDDPQTNSDSIFPAVLQYVNQLINDVVKKSTKEKKKMTRKHSINIDNWQKNNRKRAFQLGKVNVNIRGKHIEAKKVKLTKDCFSNCKFKVC